ARRLAASRPGRSSAAPPSIITHGSPLLSAVAADSIVWPGTGDGARAATGGAGSAPSDQETSAGRTSVAMLPGGRSEAAIASAASAPMSAERAGRLTQQDTAPARASISDSSGASKRL